MAKTKKKWGCLIAVIIVLVLVIGGIIVAISMAGSMMQTAAGYPYGKVSTQNLASYVNVSGTVASSNTLNITTELSQKITKLNVKVGDTVKKGDVLCEFDTTALQENYDRLTLSADQTQDAEDYQMSILRRNLNTAKQDKNAALNQAQQAINRAENERDSAYNTYNSNVLAYNQLMEQLRNADPEEAAMLQKQAEQLDSANQLLYPQLAQLDAAVDTAYAAYKDAGRAADMSIQAAQDAIDAKQYTPSDSSSSEQLKKLQEQIDDCVITAPADGIITQINAVEGSSPMGAALMKIEDTDALVIRGIVPEADILKVQEGMNCEIKNIALEDQILTGQVKRVEHVLSPDASAVGVSGYAVEISINDPDDKMLLGMSANVKIIIDKVDNALSVPYEAVRGGENEGYFVYVCEPTGTEGTVKVVKKSVEIGFEGDYYTELKSGDLKEGDIVFTGKYGTMLPGENEIIPDPTLLNPLKEDSE